MQFTTISKHPLKNTYMLHAKGTSLPPYFASKKECEKIQPIWEKKLNEEFNKLPKEEQKRILEYIKK